jgi:hypothetical protein
MRVLLAKACWWIGLSVGEGGVQLLHRGHDPQGRLDEVGGADLQRLLVQDLPQQQQRFPAHPRPPVTNRAETATGDNVRNLHHGAAAGAAVLACAALYLPLWPLNIVLAVVCVVAAMSVMALTPGRSS